MSPILKQDLESFATCTCGNEAALDPDSHDFLCNLWDDFLFCKGEAEWNGQKLVYVGDTTVEEDDHVEDAVLFWPRVDPTSNEHDAVSYAMMELFNCNYDQVETGAVEEAVDIIGEDICDVFEMLAFAQQISPDDYELLNTFGAVFHEDADKDVVFEPYFCQCNHGSHIACFTCGVYRPDGDKSPWVPLTQRRVREIQMFLKSETYNCACTNKPKALICTLHEVQRDKPDSNWTYFMPFNKIKDGKTKIWKDTSAGANSSSSGYSYSSGSLWSGNGVTTTYQKCRHYGAVVKLPDGTEIICSSQHDPKDRDDAYPDFGCYMASSWKPDWRSYWLNWNDYGLPNMSMAVVDQIVDDLLKMSREGYRVEIGCIGGHGRTGSLLALLALKAGIDDPEKAIEFVHTTYCEEAIESARQEWYIEAYSCWLKGTEIPPQPAIPCGKWKHERMFEGKDPDCSPKCPDYDKHWVDWDADQAKKQTSSGKPNQNTKSHSPSQQTTEELVYKPVTWDTPIPTREPQNQWCSMRRHYVLYWRQDACELGDGGRPCQHWSEDLQMFKNARREQAPMHEVVQRMLDAHQE